MAVNEVTFLSAYLVLLLIVSKVHLGNLKFVCGRSMALILLASFALLALLGLFVLLIPLTYMLLRLNPYIDLVSS